MEWLDCEGEFIEGDVIRWQEAVWETKRARKPQRIGERSMTAEIIERDPSSGLITLLIRQSKILSDQSRHGNLQPLKNGETIRRQPKTLCHGQPRRLSWSEEDVRREVARTLGQPPPRPPQPDTS